MADEPVVCARGPYGSHVECIDGHCAACGRYLHARDEDDGSR